MIALLAALLALQDSQLIGFEKDPWDGCAVGSWVKLKRTTGARSDETTYTLMDVKAGYKRIKTDPAPEDPVEAQYGGIVTHVPYTKVLETLGLKQNGRGSDVLKIGVKARALEFNSPDAGQIWLGRLRVALSDEVPGGVGKVVIDLAGDKPVKLTFEAVAREKLAAGERKVDCTRFDLEISQGKNERTTGAIWYSSSVPGLTVKARTKRTRGKVTTEQTIDVVGFESKK